MILELQEFGLNERESKIYIQVLKDQGETASIIAKRTGINRTTTYLELDNLINKGLISYHIKNKIRYYNAVEPEKLVDILELKKKKINSILPQLKSLHKTAQPFKTEILEGKEGVKTLYQEIIRNSKEVCAFGVTGTAFDALKFDFPHLAEEAKHKNLKIKYLANENAKTYLKKLPEKFVEIKYLPKGYESDVTTIIYNNKIAIQSLVKDNVFVVIIENEALNKGYKNYFEYIWRMT